MRTTEREFHSPCPVAVTAMVVGGKWKSIILYYLLADGRKRFSELRRLIPGVTQRMLTLQLRELESDGLVSRTVFAEVPPRVDYALTPFGESLRDVLLAMRAWGIAHRKDVLDTSSPPECVPAHGAASA
jgi:DNA-binding HxlR family transcriptional regulator